MRTYFQTDWRWFNDDLFLTKIFVSFGFKMKIILWRIRQKIFVEIYKTIKYCGTNQ